MEGGRGTTRDEAEEEGFLEGGAGERVRRGLTNVGNSSRYLGSGEAGREGGRVGRKGG